MAKETYRNPLEKRTVTYRGGRYSVRLAGNQTYTTDDDELKTAFKKSGFVKARAEEKPEPEPSSVQAESSSTSSSFWKREKE